MAQHVDERFSKELAEWLAGTSKLPVKLAEAGDSLTSGQIYISDGGRHLVFSTPRMLDYRSTPLLNYQPSVDVLFDSARKHATHELLGILLTGMGRDGSQGLKRLRDSGHCTIAQDEASSAIYGMPRAAAMIGAATEILPLAKFRVASSRGLRHKGRHYERESDDDQRRLRDQRREDDGPVLSTTRHWVASPCAAPSQRRRTWIFISAPDAQQAVGQAKAVRPTVILQDLVMPGTNGLDLLRAYRSNPALESVPVIVLSVHEEAETKRDAFAAGANDYLVKLPDRVELVARIRYHSRAYLAQKDRDEAMIALRESQRELVDSNTALISLNQKLEVATRAKSEFLGDHEPRNPDAAQRCPGIFRPAGGHAAQ